MSSQHPNSPSAGEHEYRQIISRHGASASDPMTRENADVQAPSATDIKPDDIYSEDGATILATLGALQTATQLCRCGHELSVKLNDTLTLDARAVKRLVALASSDEPQTNRYISIAALTLLASIAEGDDMCREALTHADILPILQNVLEHSKGERRIAAISVVFGLSGGAREHVRLLVEHGIVPWLVATLHADGETVTLKERKLAVNSLCRMLENSSEGLALSMLDAGLLQAVRDALSTSHVDMVRPALVILKCILDMPRRANPMAPEPTPMRVFVEEAGILDHIDALQNHPEHDIYESCYDLLRRHFVAVDVDPVD